MRVVQQKQHEAQQVKIQHMQEFVDKFRYNAKRASLVQSRIKTIERETIVGRLMIILWYIWSYVIYIVIYIVIYDDILWYIVIYLMYCDCIWVELIHII